MATFTPGDLTFNRKEIMEFAEAVREDLLIKPELNAFHTIVDGIKAKQQIAIIGQLGNVGKAATNCAPVSDGNIPWTEKEWDPNEVEIRLEDCWKTMLPSFQAWGFKNGVKKSDLTGTDYMNYVGELLTDAILETVFRVAWLNDKLHDDIAGGGVITNGVSPAYYTMIDGFWNQIEALPASQIFTITENAGATFLLQALADDAALAIFEDLKYGADFRLRDSTGQQVIVCTQSIADNYAATLRSKGVDLSFERIEGGYTQLMFEGIPVIPFSFLDRKILSDQNTTVFLNLPHRAVYTTVENLQIGLDSQAEHNEIDLHYDKTTKKIFNDALFSIDAKIPLDFLVRAAF